MLVSRPSRTQKSLAHDFPWVAQRLEMGINERFVSHGTTKDKLVSILEGGFNERFAKRLGWGAVAARYINIERDERCWLPGGQAHLPGALYDAAAWGRSENCAQAHF